MTQENLKLKNVQNEKQISLEVWDNLDVIPSKTVYPDNLPADNVDAALYLMNLNK